MDQAKAEEFAKAADDLEYYGKHFLVIADKRGHQVPLEFNSAQRIVHERAEEMLKRKGYVRLIVVKGRQQGLCLAPETRVLTADMRWVRIDQLSLGDRLVACDEFSLGRHDHRKMRTASVEAIWRSRRASLRITLDDGRSVICSGEHRWLYRNSNTTTRWLPASRMRIGGFMRSVTDAPWGESGLDDAWFGGMIDGEGAPWYEGKRLPHDGWHRIVSIEQLGGRDLVDIQTSTGTFIAEGLVSHNSTYVQARFRHRMKHRAGSKTYTVAHELKSTQNLFKMAKRYQEGEPDWSRPALGASNANELWLSKLDSRLEIVTAGTGDAGRSGTAQFLHGSEAAYWPDPESTWAALGQVIPSGDLMAGTEVIIESTGNGPNDFAERARMAQKGEGDFELVFVPWFMQAEYRQEPHPGFELSEDEDPDTGVSEKQVAETFGLRLDQMAWRRSKINTDFKGSVTRFMREYPAHIEEAFVTGGSASFYPAMLVARAQRTELPATGRILIGADPAVSDEGDRFGLCVRQGRRVHMLKGYRGKTGPQIAAILRNLIDKYKGNGVLVMLDVGGLGIVIYQMLCDWGLDDYVQAVNFGSAAIDDETFANRKAELYYKGREFLKLGGHLPPAGEIMTEFVSTRSDEDVMGRIRIESKKAVKKRVGFSPDLLEAYVLTFDDPAIAVKKRDKPIQDGAMTADQYWQNS